MKIVMRKAVVVYSFGGSPRYGPGPANIALAQIAARVTQETKAILVVQDYLEALLRKNGIRPDFVVHKHQETKKFLGTEEVTRQFAKYLRSHGISKVLLIAHPFLHWRKCRHLLKKAGLDVKCISTLKVPFDRSCENWWVRSPLHLLLYSFLQFAFNRHGC